MLAKRSRLNTRKDRRGHPSRAIRRGRKKSPILTKYRPRQATWITWFNAYVIQVASPRNEPKPARYGRVLSRILEE